MVFSKIGSSAKDLSLSSTNIRQNLKILQYKFREEKHSVRLIYVLVKFT